MDLTSIEQRLQTGESLKIKYRYPLEADGHTRRQLYAVRSDRLLDVSIELERFYTLFRGEVPIWLEADEILELAPDDGVYQDFPGE